MKREDVLKDKIDPIDVEEARQIGELLEGFRNTSFQSRNLAECMDVYKLMLDVPEAAIFLGLSGAMVPAGMKKVICSMVRNRLVDVVVSTGANLYHDYFEALGHHHYKAHPHMDDTFLDTVDIDRVYDTVLDDRVATQIDRKVGELVAEMPAGHHSTREFFATLGESIDLHHSIIRACYEEGVPLYCPTFHDSGFGIGVTAHYRDCREQKKEGFVLDLIRDNYEVMQIGLKSKEAGVVLIGGGVPKNYIQQIAPMQEVLGYKKYPYRYAIQITTDDPKWGGLSGCTFSESHSWGKYTSDARTAVAYVDATIGLPLLVGAVLQTGKEIIGRRKRRRFTWNEDELTDLSFS
ncbi:MAG: deoxyhypusine synthase family protein [Planctomycetota bacterium]|nr:deoxyhypusine synthase family protein [Planctomycetota bacterium]